MTSTVGKLVPRINFLTDPVTSRDLFGVVRGRCKGCDNCGRYLKETAEYTVSPLEKVQGRKHPDNDVRLTDCSRCGCPAAQHEVVEHEYAKEQGNDAYALGQFDTAVVHYSKALQLNPADATLWSNRAAAYQAKGWYEQSLHDAEHALSLRPDWAKAWGRKGAALAGLGKHGRAGEAYRRGLALDPGSLALQQGLSDVQAAHQLQARQQRQQQMAAAASEAATKSFGASIVPSPPATKRSSSAGALPPHHAPALSPPPAERAAPRRRASTHAWPSPATESYYTADSSRGNLGSRARPSGGKGPSVPANSAGCGSDGVSSSYGSAELRSGLQTGQAADTPSWGPRSLGKASAGAVTGAGTVESGHQHSPQTALLRSPAAMLGPDVSMPHHAQGPTSPLQPSTAAQAATHSLSPSHAAAPAAVNSSNAAAGRNAAAPPPLPAALALQWEQLQVRVGRAVEEMQGIQQQMWEFSAALATLFPAPPEHGPDAGRAAVASIGDQHGSSGAGIQPGHNANTAGGAAVVIASPSRSMHGSQQHGSSRSVGSCMSENSSSSKEGVQRVKAGACSPSGSKSLGGTAAAAAGSDPMRYSELAEAGLSALPSAAASGHAAASHMLAGAATDDLPAEASYVETLLGCEGSEASIAVPAFNARAADLASENALLLSSSVASLSEPACSGGMPGIGPGHQCLAGSLSSTSMEPAPEEAAGNAPISSPGACPPLAQPFGRHASSPTEGGSSSAGSPPGAYRSNGGGGDDGSSVISDSPVANSIGATPTAQASGISMGCPTSVPSGDPSWVAEFLGTSAAVGDSCSDNGSERAPSSGSAPSMPPHLASPFPQQTLSNQGAAGAAVSLAAQPAVEGARQAAVLGASEQGGSMTWGVGAAESTGSEDAEGSDSQYSAEHSFSGSDSCDESSGEEWLRGVEEARRKLAAGSSGGRIQPPVKGDRRASRASTAGGGGGSSVSIAALQSLVDGAASAMQWKKDTQGIARSGCKKCGVERCPSYAPYSLEQLVSAAWTGRASGPAPATVGDLPKLTTAQRLCACCGCDCGMHETKEEASLREARAMRARMREQRLARLREEEEPARAGQGSRLPPAIEADSVQARRGRVLAALARKAAADSGGEQLQASDCEMLNHSKRGKCGACADCAGFCILFRASDANDPEVMFYCSSCGCRSDAHEIDKAWAQQEEARRRAEKTAAQRAKQAQQAAAQQHSRLVQQQEEEKEAYRALGLPMGADAKSIARAYKRLALQLHPDKQQQGVAAAGMGVGGEGDRASAAAAQERFMEVAAAYKFLAERKL